jgi:hypothetical protein
VNQLLYYKPFLGQSGVRQKAGTQLHRRVANIFKTEQYLIEVSGNILSSGSGKNAYLTVRANHPHDRL